MYLAWLTLAGLTYGGILQVQFISAIKVRLSEIVPKSLVPEIIPSLTLGAKVIKLFTAISYKCL
jgi:hypothetical protein